MHRAVHYPRLLRVAAILALAIGWSASPIAAQSVGTVRGKVAEEGSQRPLSGVQISIPGTRRGALSNAAGEFLILNAPTGAQRVRAQMIGYNAAEQSIDVTAGQTARVDFELSPAAIALNEIVVTGTPGATSKRTIGNAITKVNTADVVEKVANSTVAELLQGKAPGVTMLPGGGTVGTGGSIRIRGANSLAAGNDPVIYVDGVRIHSGRAGNFNASTYGEGQRVMALDAINPEDIESIEILKGPAAATLYGANAAGGVIQIITQKGKPGQQQLEWSAKAQVGQTDWAVGKFRNYTTCTADKISNATTWPGCQGVAAGAVINYSGLEDNPAALQTGDVGNYSLSVRGGGEGYSFFISGDLDSEEGVFRNNFSDRNSLRSNFAFYPSEDLDFSVNVGYVKSHIGLPLNDNAGGSLILSTALAYPGRSYGAGRPEGFLTTTPEQYYLFDNQLRGERLTLGGTVSYRPFSWLRNQFTAGLDYNARTAEMYIPAGNPVFGPWYVDGYSGQQTPQDEIYTTNYIGTVANRISESLSSDFSFGAQYERSRYRNTISEGFGFGSDLNRLVSQAARSEAGEEFVEQKSLGLFVQEQIGWKDRLFVTGAVRMDNNSAFGDEIQRIFYPKAMVSYLISEEPFFRLPAVDELKLRAAWGQAGNAPGPFAAARTYLSSVATLHDGATVPALRLGDYGNRGLRPERGTEVEIGADASFLGGRLGLEATYYRQRMTDALMLVPVAPSTGFGAGGQAGASGIRFENLGETLNTGFELAVNGTPVQSRQIAWDSRLSFTTNRNELVSFGYDRGPMLFGVYAPVQRHQEGYPLGAFWATGPKRNPDGSLVLNAAGGIVPDTAKYLGPSTPTREASFANTITLFGSLQLYGLLDYKGGHYLFNVKDLRRNWRAFPLSREVNAPNTSEERRFLLLNADLRQNNIDFIQRADFIKVRDVSLTYAIPGAWSQQFGAERLSVTVAGHNMGFLWKPYYTGPDPEVNFHGPENFSRVDAWTAPMLRRVTASVNVSF